MSGPAGVRYRCSTCAAVHEGLPDLSFGAPAYYQQVAEADRAAQAQLGRDTCVIGDEDFFVRGVLEIPIRGHEATFGWGVWVSLSEKNFQRYRELFLQDPPANEGPYFGWLSNRLPHYPETLNLKTLVHLRPGGQRPRIELEPTDHPLAVHQRDGIELSRLLEIVGDHVHHGDAWPTKEKV